MKNIKYASLFLLLLLVNSCSRRPIDPTPPPPPPPVIDLSEDRGVMPEIEFQINNTATTGDDYIDEITPCRLRIVNQLDFLTDVQVGLENISTGSGASLLFSYTSTSSQVGTMTLLIPANGDWADLYIRPNTNTQSQQDKDLIIQTVLRRPNPAGGPQAGTILGRKALMVTNTPPNFRPVNIELQINNNATSADDYLTWSPMPCRIRQLGGNAPLTVNLRNFAGATGRVLFAPEGTLTPHTSTATNPTLNNITLSPDSTWVNFYIAGQFGSPSTNDKDAIIEITDNNNQLLGREALMVRIRKNANNLTTAERDRFLDALTTLNQTLNMYEIFNEIHRIGIREAHFGPAFSPWHRAFILDLERQLQAIDPAVTVPYWRFDEAAPNVFSPDFMGGASNTSVPSFSTNNPLALWRIENMSGIVRSPLFSPNQSPNIISEFATLNISNQYDAFNAGLESGPHNRAHGLAAGTGGWIGTVPTAVRDPLFFLLHTNVDRLWAKWQWANDRFDTNSVSTYTPQGDFPGSTLADAHIGHYLNDTAWPWNEITGDGSIANDQRPTAAPGGMLEAVYGYEDAPPLSPQILDLIDYQSIRSKNTINPGMGFAYDDVPFQ